MPEIPHNPVFVFRNCTVDRLSENDISLAAGRGFFVDTQTVLSVRALTVEVNAGIFSCADGCQGEVRVGVVQENGQVTVSSDPGGGQGSLTTAEATVLMAILRREEFSVFFCSSLRLRQLQRAATAYGLEHEHDLDRYLMPVLTAGRLTVEARIPGLLPVDSPKWLELGKQLHQVSEPSSMVSAASDIAIVLSRHKYYRHVLADAVQMGRTKSGRPKPPFTRLNPLDLIAGTEHIDEIKAFAAMARLQQVGAGDRTLADLEALCTLIKMGSTYAVYRHDEQLGENYSAKSLFPITLAKLPDTIVLSVRTEGTLYAVTGTVTLAGQAFPLHEISLQFGCFFQRNDVLYLIEHPLLLSVVALMREHQGKWLIHAHKYPEFHERVLDKLSNRIRVEYPDIKLGTAQQLAEAGFAERPERLIYLSDFGQHVMIIPVVRYGEAEVAIRTERQVKALDRQGNDFIVPRDAAFEEAFIALLIKQHPDLPEQLENQLYYFFLHKKQFLNEDWFLPVFDSWHQEDIEVYGFNELSDNQLNPNRVKIDIKVISGMNWFNVTHEVRFGKKKVSLKQIQAALRNKRKYVVLDDGTKGIFPREWLKKFTEYFQAGEVVDDETIHFAKANFETVATLYDATMLDESAANEIQELRERMANFETLQPVAVPKGLRVKLRPYQLQGLNWLGFLDSLHFGGLLADEMGLGKTVQIIAFMLAQRESGEQGTDLVVVPATLVFNWQRELAAIAPSLKVLTLYGAGRPRSSKIIELYDVVLTTYTTLLSDIRFLKAFTFNYVYLDESQNIKNPDSQRYKAVRLLQARNRIAISGTPFENSSFDLYGQLSFACPGLLGDKRYFRDVYSKPIDQFKNQKRRKELQQKIRPFILRRTKQEVAVDLPEKVVMTLYCELGDRQREIYDAYEKEFRDFVCALSGDDLDKHPMHVLRGLTRLRQICNSPALLPDRMLNTAVSAKIELLREQLADKAPYHKIVVFSQFVSMLNLIGSMLGEMGMRYVSLTGSTRQRKEVVTAFQEDPEVRVFLVSLKAGGTGLNLTAAEVVYLVDPWWNPAVEEQAIDRVHRIGQGKKVVAYRLVTPRTVEEKVLQLQATKSSLADELVNNHASFFRSLDKESLLELV